MSFVSVSRFRTALNRTDFSRLVRLALEDGLINQEASLFDYGCGRGSDIQLL